MKKYLLILLLSLSLFSCEFNSIYHGSKTKYAKLTDQELKDKGDLFQKILDDKYLKTYDDELKKFLLTVDEKKEYDNLLIEAITRAYSNKLKNIKDKKEKKIIRKTFYEILKDIKKLETLKEYTNYMYFNEKINIIVN